MRILAIRGKNLASLKGDFEVALNKVPLDSAGLFAITGHTGAGKSTLLDAMCLALFDKIPRLIGSAHVKVGHVDEDEKHRISSNDVGSIVSRGTAGAYAEVDFIGLDKQPYQAHWEIKRARNKVSGRLQKQSVTFKNLNSNEVIGQNKSDTLEHISECIGLTFEQFRRSVLLAQGDFAAFLKAKSDERSSLLERITGTEIYSQLSMLAYRKFQEQEQELHRIQDKMKYDLPLENQDRDELIIKVNELSCKLKELINNSELHHLMLQWHEKNETLIKEKKSVVETLSDLKIQQSEKKLLNEELQKTLSVQSLRTLLKNLNALTDNKIELQTQLKKTDKNIVKERTKLEQLTETNQQIQKKINQSEHHYQIIKPELLKARELDTQLTIIVEECVAHEKNYNELNTSLKEAESKTLNLDDMLLEKQSLEEKIVSTTKTLAEKQEQSQEFSREDLNNHYEALQNQYRIVKDLSEVTKKYSLKRSKLEEINQQELQCKKNIIDGQKSERLEQENYQTSTAQLEEARRALLMIQESVTQGAQSLRSLLRDEQACPVCGSEEHPWADQDSVLNRHYQQQAERVDELEQSKQKSLLLLNQLQQSTKHEQSLQKQHIESANLIKSELSELDKQWQATIRLDIASEFSKKLQLSMTESEVDTVLLPEMQRLIVNSEAIKELEKKAILLQKKIDQLQRDKDALHAQEKVLESHISEQKLLLNTKSHLQQQVKTLGQALEKKIAHKEALMTERLELFSLSKFQFVNQIKCTGTFDLNISADDIEGYLTQLMSELSVQLESNQASLGEAKQNLVKTTEKKNYLQQQFEKNKQNSCHHEETLNSELIVHDLELTELKRLLTHDDLWIEQQQKQFENLKNHQLKSEALLVERSEKLKQHEQKLAEFPQSLQVIQKDDLSIQLQEQLALQQKIQAEQQEKQLELKQDDVKKQRISQSLKELEAQKLSWNDWNSLNELIGSASGHKFRIFAQSLTLESLLSHANVHLNDFARRYQLQRVPGTDLDLQIMDRDMADEVRSVQSLSGGESFLVSLALALGLASLSSSKTQVESLFIDEGFGTLDQETLDIAIASLDTLQGLGRKVGIISHVPILVERIGVRVVVEKIGGGRSQVLVKG